MDEPSLTPDEIAQFRRFLEVEKIRKKKLLYSQLMDGRDPEGFANLYTEDAIAEWGQFGNWRGRDQILEQSRYTEGKPQFNWLHMTTNLWIELTGPDTATSRCYLHDVCMEPLPNISPTMQFGIYEEDWVKVDGDWKIRHHRIFFLWPVRQAKEVFARPITPTAIA
jgi:hypothetical protein